MGKLNFEEYRQPWETGPHWELKREFLEKYQNDFPEDRLLCLAQAYSNIELMHCSYPDPVMLQIHELSKSLQGCKRFREVKKNFPKDEPELQARSGKRSAFDDAKKPFKFIKFQSVGIQSSQKEDNLKAEDNVPEKASNTNISLDNLSNVEITIPTSESSTKNLSSASFTNDSSSMEVTSNFLPTPLDKEPFFSEEFGCTVSNSYSILSIARSPNFKLIQQIATTISKLQGKKKKRKLGEEIQNAANQLNVKNSIRFVGSGSPQMKRCICKFYIGDTLISIGRDNNEYHARKLAETTAMDIFGKLSYLPIKTLSDLTSDSDEEELSFIKKFTEEVTKDKYSELTGSTKILNACSALNCSTHVNLFLVREDMRSPLHCRNYFSDLVIKKVLICYGEGKNKKSSKDNTAEKGISLLAKYFNINYKSKDKPSTVVKDNTKVVPLKKKEDIDNSKQSFTEVSKTVTMVKEKNLTNSEPIIINYRLLDNSFQHQLAILDNTAIAPNSNKTPRTVLNYTMQFCKKQISYELSEPIQTAEGFEYRCDVMFEGRSIGLGVGTSKSEAKCTACIKSLEYLQNQVYTIKIKNEAEEGFFIQRSQIIDAEVPSNVVSDNNIGCKMLKMMGWSGGSLGNSGGITEPIVASEHRFHQGLGFSKGNDNFNKFRSKIDVLLREFSQTETTSDLIFGLDFTKDERKHIHRLSDKFGLVSSSRGSGKNRQLFVRHKLTINQLLNQLVRAGGRTSKYEFVDKSS